MIALDDVVLRDDLDPRLGQRDDDLIAQYADIFDALPPIEINQDNELIDGWHRVHAAERAERTEIAYVVVETDGNEDLRDRMYAANLRHGVQYTREQKRAYGVRLHGRDLSANEIATLSGVGVSTVYRWTKEHRGKQKQERDAEIQRLRDAGKTQQEIADELNMPRQSVSDRLAEDSHMRKTGKEKHLVDPEPEALEPSESDPEPDEPPVEEKETTPKPEPEPDADEASAEEEADISALDSQPETDGTSAAEEEPATADPEPEPPPPEDIPDHILDTARAVMGAFAETRPDDYVARLETSPSEWMTITDDSLSNELERELLTSAAAMCLWQEWMIWYRGGSTSAFTDAFGKIGPVFVRGQAGQWTIVTRLRSILRRLWK